jgi:hypothetical protein
VIEEAIREADVPRSYELRKEREEMGEERGEIGEKGGGSSIEEDDDKPEKGINNVSTNEQKKERK